MLRQFLTRMLGVWLGLTLLAPFAWAQNYPQSPHHPDRTLGGGGRH